MAIFIPKNNLHGDKKPDGDVDLNYSPNIGSVPYMALAMTNAGVLEDIAGDRRTGFRNGVEPTYINGNNGLQLDFKAGSLNTAGIVYDLDLTHTNNVTIVTDIYNGAYGADDALAFEFTPNTNLNNGFYFDPRPSGSSVEYQISEKLGGAVHASRFPRPSLGWHRYVFVFGINSVDVVYVDGIKQNVLVNYNTGTFSGNFANSYFILNSRDWVSLFGNYSFANLFLFDHQLTESQIIDVSANPYQLLKPRKKYFALTTPLPPVNLTLTNALSSSTAQSVPVQQSNNLSLSSAVSASNAQSIAAQQSNNLVLSNSLSSSNASTINVAQTNNLVLSNSTASTNASAITVSVINPVNLSLANANSASSSGAVSIIQTNNLTLSNGLSTSNASAIAVSVIPPIDLSLANSTSATNAGAILIGQTTNLALSSATSATNASSIAASVVNSLLSLSNASSQSSASTIPITQSNNLSLSGATSASNADSIDAVQVANLSLSSSVSGTSAGTIVTAQVPPINLSLSNGTSSSSASSLSVQQSINLLLSSAQSSSLADTITATQAHILGLSNAVSTSYAKGINALGAGLGVIIRPSVKIVSTTYNVKSSTIIRSIKNA